MDEETLLLLRSFGFSQVEGSVYLELLRHPGSTGYRIARETGKSQSNAYQALSGLTGKGAASARADEPTRFDATPPAELIARLRHDHEERSRQLEASLREMAAPQSDAAIQRLRNRDQVFERARQMLEAAEATVVYEAFPTPLGLLADALIAATARLGGACKGLVLDPADAREGLNVAVSGRGEWVMKYAPQDQFSIVVDGAQLIVGVFDRETGEVRHAIWTNDPGLSYLLHNGLVSDIILHASPLIEEIGSPNLHLLGRFPPAREGLGGRPLADETEG